MEFDRRKREKGTEKKGEGTPSSLLVSAQARAALAHKGSAVKRYGKRAVTLQESPETPECAENEAAVREQRRRAWNVTFTFFPHPPLLCLLCAGAAAAAPKRFCDAADDDDDSLPSTAAARGATSGPVSVVVVVDRLLPPRGPV